MADKKISDLTETTSPGDNDWFIIETSGGNSRKVKKSNVGIAFAGAKVRKSANLTAQNVTSGAYVTWNSEDWDTNSFHDNVTNTDRLTTSTAGYYFAAAQVLLTNVVASNWAVILIHRFNSSDVLQEVVASQLIQTSSTAVRVNCCGDVSMSAGDYLKLQLQVQSDTSVDIGTESYLQIRRVG